MTLATDPERAVRRDSFDGDGAARGTARMEAFADAVFAIAITLPVVHFEMPEKGPHLGRELIALWPQYLGMVLASLVIGLYWVQHHFSGAIYRTTGHYFNLATVLFLTGIGFIAFPARVFAEHLPDEASRADAARYFTVSLAFLGITWLVKWTVGRRTGHVDARLERAYVHHLDRVYAISNVLLVAAAVLTLASWRAGVSLSLLVTCFYLVPPRTPEYQTAAPKVEGEEGTIDPDE